MRKSPPHPWNFLSEAKLPLNAKIIDIGGGDSLFVDHLLKLGYKDITVLDISANAIKRAKKRFQALYFDKFSETFYQFTF